MPIFNLKRSIYKSLLKINIKNALKFASIYESNRFNIEKWIDQDLPNNEFYSVA